MQRKAGAQPKGHAFLIMPVQGDADRQILNGYPGGPYLPRDPERRARLLYALNLAHLTDFARPNFPEETHGTHSS